jgi:hypothetical protein
VDCPFTQNLAHPRTEIKDLTIGFNKAGVVVNYDLAQTKG